MNGILLFNFISETVLFVTAESVSSEVASDLIKRRVDNVLKGDE